MQVCGFAAEGPSDALLTSARHGDADVVGRTVRRIELVQSAPQLAQLLACVLQLGEARFDVSEPVIDQTRDVPTRSTTAVADR